MKKKKLFYVYVTRVATYQVEAESAESAKDIVFSGNVDASDEETVDVSSEQSIRDSGWL